ncbi:hypothetical protein [Nocardioides humi]|uniref:hypothetical protein n=1 Tax=Nocardioides humi TaxID=449461 RepID=UPI00112E53A0|nr:hypothetical protein [Nocardioides humi]
MSLAAAQVGAVVTAQVQVSAPGRATSAWSAASPGVGPVARAVLRTPDAVRVDGSPEVGQRLSAVVTGSWTEGTALTWTWLADGEPFAGTVGAVVLTPAQAGAMIAVRVTGELAGHLPGVVVSDPVGPVPGEPIDVPTDPTGPAEVVDPGPVVAAQLDSHRPRLVGTPRVGRRLVAKLRPGRWTAGTTLTVRWYAGGKLIRRGTGHTRLRLTPAERGKRIRVVVVGKKPGYPKVERVSRRTVRVR